MLDNRDKEVQYVATNRFFPRFTSILFGLAALALGGSALAAEPVQPSARKTIGWRLTTATVVEGGRAFETRQGLYVPDYSVKAAAEAISDGTPIRKGWFTFKGTVFSPANDRPGQKAGRWYLQGGWKISALDADPKEANALYSSSRVEGELSAETDVNPADHPGASLEGKVVITGNQAAGRWTTGIGSFTGSAGLEGSLIIDVEQRPDLNRPKKPVTPRQ